MKEAAFCPVSNDAGFEATTNPKTFMLKKKFPVLKRSWKEDLPESV